MEKIVQFVEWIQGLSSRIGFKAGRVVDTFFVFPCLMVCWRYDKNKSGYSLELVWLRWGVGVIWYCR